MKRYDFILDGQLGIKLPQLNLEWEEYTTTERADIAFQWEQAREIIAGRRKELERVISLKQQQLMQEDDFAAACQLNHDISEMALLISELNLWYRVSYPMDTGNQQPSVFWSRNQNLIKELFAYGND